MLQKRTSRAGLRVSTRHDLFLEINPDQHAWLEDAAYLDNVPKNFILRRCLIYLRDKVFLGNLHYSHISRDSLSINVRTGYKRFHFRVTTESYGMIQLLRTSVERELNWNSVKQVEIIRLCIYLAMTDGLFKQRNLFS